MFKRKCVVKYVDGFGIEHAAKVEAESLFEVAIPPFSLAHADAGPVICS